MHKYNKWLTIGLVAMGVLNSQSVLAQDKTEDDSTNLQMTTQSNKTITSYTSINPDWRTWAIVGGTGLAIVGIGIGAGFSVASASDYANFIDERERLIRGMPIETPICPDGELDLRCQKMINFGDAADRNQTIGIVGFTVGGIAAVGALALVVWKLDERIHTKTTFAITPSADGIFATGTF